MPGKVPGKVPGRALLLTLCLSLLALIFHDHPNFIAWIALVGVFGVPAFLLWAMVWMEKDLSRTNTPKLTHPQSVD